MADLNQAKLLPASSLSNGKLLLLTLSDQLVHVAVNNQTEWDVVTIDANNKGASSAECVISWGGTEIIVDIGKHVIVTVIDRWRINAGLEIKARASAVASIVISCQVDRYPVA